MKSNTNLKLYFIFTYLLFWILLGVTGFLISLDIPILYQNIIKNLCAWTPTFVILIGYALKAFQKKYSPFKSSLFIGLAWGFCHLPLWIISGYSGLDLIIYCGAFLLAIVSLSIVITYFYNKSGNILIAMWIHFLFNFLLQLVLIDLLQLLIYISLGYLMLAIILILFYKNELRAPSSLQSIQSDQSTLLQNQY